MKNHCRESVGFLFRATLWFRRLVILFLQSFLRSMLHNSTFLLFSPSSVMILLPFLSCFLLFFFVKDEIASFQLKQIIVFLNYRKSSMCVFISLHDCDRV